MNVPIFIATGIAISNRPALGGVSAPVSEELRAKWDREDLYFTRAAIGCGILVLVAAGAAFAVAVKQTNEYRKRDAAKTQHVMYVPDQIPAYFQKLNQVKGHSCEVNFEDGKKHPDRKYYPSVKSLGDCAWIAFQANQSRTPSHRGISFELNANAKENSTAGSGICDFREKTAKPYCYTTTYTDKFFLEMK